MLSPRAPRSRPRPRTGLAMALGVGLLLFWVGELLLIGGQLWKPQIPTTDCILGVNGDKCSASSPSVPIRNLAASAADMLRSELHPLAREKFTLMTLTHPKRLPSLKVFVAFHSRCAAVEEIVLVWSNGPPPDIERVFAGAAVPVRLREEVVNSLNNRFRPDPLLRTRAVLQLDDDIIIRCSDLVRGFVAWQQQPDSIVGFFPRKVRFSPTKYVIDVYAEGSYNILLTKGAFLDAARAFQLYWSEANAAARAVVDELFNCEDILMNFVWANQSRSALSASTSRHAAAAAAVMFVSPRCFLETSPLSKLGISSKAGHYGVRPRCADRFAALFGGSPLQPVAVGPSAVRPQELWARSGDAWDTGTETSTAMAVMRERCPD